MGFVIVVAVRMVVVRVRGRCVTVAHQVVDLAVRHFTLFGQQASVGLAS